MLDNSRGALGEPAWPAPAKLNLFLHIIGRRADGYHRLQTVFHFLDYGDELEFSPRADGLISVQGSEVPGVAAGDNIVVRAARLLQQQAQTAQGTDIRLRKRLPVGGGLGGGSSDAATTLVALNRLWNLGLTIDRLAALGLQLGADVPVFVRGQTAWAEGVGEQLSPIEVPEKWYLVITPDCQVSTAEIFNDPELKRDTPPIKMPAVLNDLSRTDWRNDCLAVVRRRHPPVAEALKFLEQHAEARLTGTGASVFAAFDTREAARRVQERVPPHWQSFVAKGLSRSPLLALGQRSSDGVVLDSNAGA